jgi:hypothetical protein
VDETVSGLDGEEKTHGSSVRRIVVDNTYKFVRGCHVAGPSLHEHGKPLAYVDE